MLFIVLPAYNEAHCIVELMEAVAGVMARPSLNGMRYRIIVVDDGSSDGTGEKVIGATKRIPAELVRHGVNRGVDRAFHTGFTRALEEAGEDDFILTMDADNTHQPAHIEELIAEIRKGYDVVVSSRYRKGSVVRNVPPGRLCQSWMARFILTALYRIPGITDYTIFYRIYRPSALRRAFDRYGERIFEAPGFTSMAELLIKLHRLPPPRIRFSETPTVLLYGIKLGPSKMKILRNIREYARMIARFTLGV